MISNVKFKEIISLVETAKGSFDEINEICFRASSAFVNQRLLVLLKPHRGRGQRGQGTPTLCGKNNEFSTETAFPNMKCTLSWDSSDRLKLVDLMR